MKVVAGFIVFSCELSLSGLPTVIFWKPDTAKRFLKFFASSAKSYYTEQVLRLIAGSAMDSFSFGMKSSLFFEYFGLLIVATAIFLLLILWQWHYKFGPWPSLLLSEILTFTVVQHSYLDYSLSTIVGHLTWNKTPFNV
jgi:hypothetical protein